MNYMIKNLFKYSIFVLFFMSYQATAEIIETNSLKHFEEAAEAADNNIIVIFDVQEVLMVATDQILSPLHKPDFRIIKDNLVANYTPADQEKLFSIILKEYKTENVDITLVKTLDELKLKGVKALGLTSGYTGKYGVIENREDLRLERLKKIGINFKDSFPNVKPIIFSNLKGADPKHLPMFKDGILFACRLSKGEVLKAFLKQINYKPRKIIFVDNQLKNIKTVEQYCASEGIEYIGFHYNFIKSKPKNKLNMNVVSYQIETLEKHHTWLSDQEALEQLSKK